MTQFERRVNELSFVHFKDAFEAFTCRCEVSEQLDIQVWNSGKISGLEIQFSESFVYRW